MESHADYRETASSVFILRQDGGLPGGAESNPPNMALNRTGMRPLSTFIYGACESVVIHSA